MPAEQQWYEPVRPAGRRHRRSASRRCWPSTTSRGDALARGAVRREGQDPGGERRRRARGDEPVRGRPALAGAPAADHVAGDVVAARGAAGAPRARPSTTTPRWASPPWSARRSTWARGRSRSWRATRTRPSVGSAWPTAAPARSTPGPAGRSSTTRRPGRAGRPAADRRRAAVRAARDRLAGARLRAAAVVGQGARPDPRAVRRGRGGRPPRPPGRSALRSRPRPRAGSTSPTWPPAPSGSSTHARGLPRRLRGVLPADRRPGRRHAGAVPGAGRRGPGGRGDRDRTPWHLEQLGRCSGRR